MNAVEIARNAEFHRNPMFRDFISCALQDLQFSENDQACEEKREPLDVGTIYTLSGMTFVRMTALCDRFERECAAHIDAALKLEPQGDGFEYAREPMTLERIGSTLWLALTNSGVNFTDDGDASCLKAMSNWARAIYCEGLYFGGDGQIYLVAY